MSEKAGSSHDPVYLFCRTQLHSLFEVKRTSAARKLGVDDYVFKVVRFHYHPRKEDLMEVESVEALLIKAINAVEKASGRMPSKLDSGMRPIGDLKDFDSLNGVEVTIEVSTSLGADVPFNDVFIDDKKGRSLTIAQSARRLAQFIKIKTIADIAK